MHLLLKEGIWRRLKILRCSLVIQKPLWFFSLCQVPSFSFKSRFSNFVFLAEWQNLIGPFELGKFWSLETPPQKKKISLKHLKLPKNHFKTNLFFNQLNHSKSTFTSGKSWKSGLLPSFIKKSKFWLFFYFWPWSSLPLPHWISSTFWDILFLKAPLTCPWIVHDLFATW